MTFTIFEVLAIAVLWGTAGLIAGYWFAFRRVNLDLMALLDETQPKPIVPHMALDERAIDRVRAQVK